MNTDKFNITELDVRECSKINGGEKGNKAYYVSYGISWCLGQVYNLGRAMSKSVNFSGKNNPVGT